MEAMELETKQKNKSANIMSKVHTYFNVVHNILVSNVAIYMSFLCYSVGSSAVSWHAWLCTIGYQLLMTHAILSLNPDNVWSKHHARPTQKRIHWMLQLAGSIAAIAGMVIHYIGRERGGKPHMSSVHSAVGLTAGIFTLISLFSGISALWSYELRKFMRPVSFKLVHMLFGLAAFLLGLIALFFAYDNCFMVEHSREDIRLCLHTAAILCIVLTLIGVIRALREGFVIYAMNKNPN